jgi:UDP-glucuronate 4-epimerase
MRTYADITKLREMTGYNPSLTFEEGTKKFIKWYKSRIKHG